MPSGKRARQQRRETATALKAPPPVRSKGVGGAGRARQASPRALAIAGGVTVIAVIAIVLGVVLSRGGSSGSSGNPLSGLPRIGSATWSGALAGAPQANNLFKGIPQKGLVLGKTSAVEMDMFIDVQCPLCQEYEVNSLPTVVQQNIRAGQAQLHLKPWAFIGAQSFSGRLGVIAASFQNKGFQYAKVLYDNQPPNSENTGYLTSRWMAQIAASVTGLNLRRWWSDVIGSKAKSIAQGVDTLAKQDNVRGTPTVLVGCSGGKLRDVTAPGLVPTLQQTQQAISGAACRQ